MFYANISYTRADMPRRDTDVMALACVNAAPAMLMTPASHHHRGYRAPAPAGRKGLPAKTADEQRFSQYLQLHQSRSESPAQEPAQYAEVR